MRLVIAYTSVGAGHARAAQAIEAALKRLDPPIDAEVIDVLDHAPWWFRRLYAGGYGWAASHWPGLYGFFYRALNQRLRWYQRPAEWFRLRLETLATRRFALYLARRQPLHLVSAHVFFAPHVGVEFARLLDRVRHIVVVTDNEAHRFWVAEGTERYFVNSQDVTKDLVGFGVARERITVSGIPVDPLWYEACDPAAVRARWALPADRPIVLMVGGANFTVGPFGGMVRRFVEANPHLHLVAITGRNRKVYERLSRMSRVIQSLTVIEFTDRLHELMSVASLLITKPGGLITQEALVKRVPMILVNPIPGQETANARYLTRHGAARLAASPDEVSSMVGEILGDEQRCRRMKAAACSLAKTGAQTIAGFIKEWMSESSGQGAVAGRSSTEKPCLSGR